MIRTGAAFSANYNCQPGLRVVWRGGNLYNGRNAGRSYSNLNNDPSNSNANRGSLSLFYIQNKNLRIIPLAAGGTPHAKKLAGRNEPMQHREVAPKGAGG